MRRGAILAAAIAIASCGPERSTTTTHATIGGDTVARVGALAIPASLVGQVAGAQGIAPKEALDRLIDDALAAQGALAAGDDRAPRVAWAIDTIVARTIVDRVAAEAHATPPTDTEVNEATAENWREYDLPEQVKVMHALVKRPADAAKLDAARALAAKLASTEAEAKDAADFEARANALPHEGLELVVQTLPAITADGRAAEGAPTQMVAPFAKAAFALAKPGDTSGAVETEFGWHVIRLLERRPPHVVPFAERRDALAGVIYMQREKDALEARIDAVRSATKIDVRPDALVLMASVKPEAPEAPAGQ